MADGAVPDRNLALELVRVTEAAALGCGRWIGRGDKIAADQAAVDAMRAMLDTVSMSGVVVIGEGEKDEAPMLYNGEDVGNGQPPEVDVAVDPLEGTRLTSVGQPNAIAVIAVSERGSMFFPGAAVYMDKLVGGEEVAEAVSIDAAPGENVRRAAEAKGVKPSEIAVVVLDRERNQTIIDGLREAGAKVNLITDGDVAPAIAAARQGTGVDLMMGIGGTPEGVIAAAAVKCLGGVVQGRLWPRNDGGAPSARRRRLRPRPRAHDGRPRRRRQRLRLRHGRHRRRAPPRGALHAGRRSDRVGRHALPLRDGQAHRGPARAGQARALLGPRVSLSPAYETVASSFSSSGV